MVLKSGVVKSIQKHSRCKSMQVYFVQDVKQYGGYAKFM